VNRLDALREQFGGVHPLAATKVKDHLEPLVRAFVEASSFIVMASANAAGQCDASPKGGLPGFLRVLDTHTLLIPDYGGNRLFQSYENVATNPQLGLICMIPGMSVTARVNGRVELLERAALEAQGITVSVNHPDDNAVLVQGLKLHVDEAYLHCPRALQFADLWDAETIARNRARSLKSLLDNAR